MKYRALARYEIKFAFTICRRHISYLSYNSFSFCLSSFFGINFVSYLEIKVGLIALLKAYSTTSLSFSQHINPPTSGFFQAILLLPLEHIRSLYIMLSNLTTKSKLSIIHYIYKNDFTFLLDYP